MNLRLIWLLTLVCLLSPASHAQRDDVLSREADDGATTRDERQRVLATLTTAAGRLRDGGHESQSARLLNRAAHLQLRLHLPEDALATYQHALTLQSQSSDASTYIDSLNGLSAAYLYLSRCGDAQNPLRQSIALSEREHYVAGKAEALLTLSGCQNYADHSLALKTAQQSLALWQSLDLKRGIARAYAAIGYYQLAQNNLAEATENHTAALHLWRELGDPDGQADALIDLGFIEYRKADWQSVLDFLTQAQGLLDEKAEPQKMGRISGGLAEAFIESGLPETGLAKFHQSLEYFRQARQPRAVNAVVWGIGRTHYILGNYPEALENLRRALKDAESTRDTTVVAMCHDYLGRTLAATGDSVAALRHFEVALELYTQVANRMEAARVRALLGQVYEQQGKFEKAKNAYQLSLQTFGTLSDDVNRSATLYALGRLELKRDNLDAAEEYLRQSIDVTENMRRFSTSHDLTAAFSATVHERYEHYIECLMRRHRRDPRRGFDVRALETSELSRGRSLAELLRATETNLLPGLDPQLAAREKSLRQMLRVREDDKVALLGRAYKKEELAALESELSGLAAQYKPIYEIIRARYPAYERITRPAAWDLRRIQQHVVADDETVLLEYILGAEKSYVWAVTRERVTSYELPARAVIDEAAQRVYRLLAAPPADDAAPDEASAAARELSRMVLSPVASELNKRRVVVVADGALHYIPFQVLHAPSAGREAFVADYEIVYAPSASILGELRQEAARRQPAAKVLAAFGNPVFASNYAQHKNTGEGEHLFAMQMLSTGRPRNALRDIELDGDTFDPSIIQPLFYAKRELANLRDAALAAGESFVAAEFAATREDFLGADLTQYAILHFATHGFLDPKRPENSGFVLSTVNLAGQAQNGFVGLRDIYALRAPVNLVVLSACRTALGKDVRGEGLMGLTRGFMYAGATSVVSSLWKVDDEATAELMKQFYINMLQKSMTPAAALRAAQNSIRQRPQWRAPYYWAAFTLQGEYRHVIKPVPAASMQMSRLKIMTGVGSSILLAGVAWSAWRYRRRRWRAA